MQDRHFDQGDVSEALEYLDANSEREVWVRYGMAIKSEFGDSGFDLFDQWSASTSGTYKPADVKSTWRSINGGGGITLGTLIQAAMANGWKPRQRDEVQLAELAKERKARQVLIEKEREREAQRMLNFHGLVADAAGLVWNEHCTKAGRSPYLGVKKIKAFGVRFFQYGVIVVTHELPDSVEVITGKANIDKFFKRADRSELSFKYIRPGTLAVPLLNQAGQLCNLQLIYGSGKKSFLKYGRKQGLFSLFDDNQCGDVVAVVEGYATGASVHEATGWPFVVAFDCGNLKPVAQAVREIYPNAELVFCADDDRETTGNPGVSKAREAAAMVGGVVAVPEFVEDAA